MEAVGSRRNEMVKIFWKHRLLRSSEAACFGARLLRDRKLLRCFVLLASNFFRSSPKLASDQSCRGLIKTTLAEDFVQESFEIPVDFCWSTEPVDVVYLLNKNVSKSNENLNMDLFKASVKGLSLYLPWIRTIHVFTENSRTGNELESFCFI